jgi:hypothetical protein
MTKIVIRSIEAQLLRWITAACQHYRLHTVPRRVFRKALNGGRDLMLSDGPHRARSFIYRKVSKHWQRLNAERIAAFVAEFRAACERPNFRRAA